MNLRELYKQADYRDKSGMLFNADCIEVMKEMENESIDLIVTDPPYKVTARGCAGNSGECYKKK